MIKFAFQFLLLLVIAAEKSGDAVGDDVCSPPYVPDGYEGR